MWKIRRGQLAGLIGNCSQQTYYAHMALFFALRKLTKTDRGELHTLH